MRVVKLGSKKRARSNAYRGADATITRLMEAFRLVRRPCQQSDSRLGRYVPAGFATSHSLERVGGREFAEGPPARFRSPTPACCVFVCLATPSIAPDRIKLVLPTSGLSRL